MTKTKSTLVYTQPVSLVLLFKCEKQHQRNRLCVNQSTLCLSHSPLLFPIYTHDYLNSRTKVRNVSVATDEGPSPKLALSEGGSRGNIES